MPERRFNPPKPEDLAARKIGFPVRRENNQKSGEQRLESGDFVPFRGFDRERESGTYAFYLELTPESQAEIMERVVEPLREIAQNNEIEAVYPNYGDIPPHVTFDAARFVNLDPSQKQELVSNLDHNLYLAMIARILSGLDFPMDNLVVGPSSYICTGEFSTQLYPLEKARRLIEKVFGRNFDGRQGEPKGLETIDYRDILHSSVARIIKIPDDKTRLVGFRDEAYKKVGEDLKSSPLSISVARAFHSLAINFEKNNSAWIANS